MEVSNYIQVLGGALIGAIVTLLSSLFSNIISERRFKKEMILKEREQKLSLLKPLSERRITALEDIYDLIQIIIEHENVTLDNYNVLRKKIIYLDNNNRDNLIFVLRQMVNIKGNDSDKIMLINKLKEIQIHIEDDLGLNFLRNNLIVNK